jgi:multidrug efflux pump subunit AcrA (membrane-fusion protein)
MIEKISIEKDTRVYEWESLFTIRTAEGRFEEVRVGLSGIIQSLEVEVGDEVIPGMVLAYINEDLVASGSD